MVQFIDKKKHPEKALLPELKFTQEGVTVVMYPGPSGDDQERPWEICTFTPGGNLVLHSGISAQIGLQVDRDGQILTHREI